ncbi:MAG: efflux RND transporter periplasmic adaptor subunit [Chloroflexota bacterium]
MKLTFRATLISVCLLLIAAGCSGGNAPTVLPTVVLNADSSTAAGAVTASGVVVPARRAELSFPLTGVVRTVLVQVGDRAAAGDRLVELDPAVLEAEAHVADADLQAAQIAYTYLARTGTDQEHLDSALADVARAQALLDAKTATLTQATLLAPFDGTVASIDISPAETVVPGQVVLTLGDLTTFQVETTDLSERDAPRVQVGQSAEVEIVALGKQIPGTVAVVARIASTVGGDVVYKVTITLDSQPNGLLWGMSSTVRISTGG